MTIDAATYGKWPPRRKRAVSGRVDPWSMTRPSMDSLGSWAEVRAHGQVMRYQSRGTGQAVLVLFSDERDGVWGTLLGVLAMRFRLILPELPRVDVDLSCWLTALLEGLGIASVRILAEGRFCAPSVELALLEAEQIAGLVLLTSDRDEKVRLAGARAAAIQRAEVPLLMVRREDSADVIGPLITGFLGDMRTIA
jgi:hypothetical protein